MSEETIIEQYKIDRIEFLLSEIRRRESLIARQKNELVAMGFAARTVNEAVSERAHTVFCATGTMLGKDICVCCKPEAAFTAEVF